MTPTDQFLIHTMTLVTAQLLREAGINVDLQAMDWGAVTQRRLEDELERTLLDLEESEREIAVLDAKYRAWCSRSRSRQDAGGRSGPKRRRT